MSNPGNVISKGVSITGTKTASGASIPKSQQRTTTYSGSGKAIKTTGGSPTSNKDIPNPEFKGTPGTSVTDSQGNKTTITKEGRVTTSTQKAQVQNVDPVKEVKQVSTQKEETFQEAYATKIAPKSYYAPPVQNNTQKEAVKISQSDMNTALSVLSDKPKVYSVSGETITESKKPTLKKTYDIYLEPQETEKSVSETKDIKLPSTSNTYTATTTKDFQGRLREKAAISKTFALRNPEVKTVANIESFGLGVVSGVVGVLTNPVETVKSVVTTPVYVIGDILNYNNPNYESKVVAPLVQSFTMNPEYILGQVTGSQIVVLGAKILYQKSPVKVEYEAMKVPTVKGEEVVARTVGIKVGQKGYPVISSTKKGLSVGNPSVKVSEIVTKGKTFYQPKTAVGTAVFEKNIKQFITKPTRISETKVITAVEYQDFILKQLKAQREVGSQSSIFTDKKVLQEGTKTLNPQAVKQVLDVSKKRGGTVYGSKATDPQLKPGIRRDVGDIDIHFETSNEKTLSLIAQETLKKIQKYEPTASIDSTSPYTINVKRDGVTAKAVEFKGIGIGDGQEVPGKAFGYDLNIESNKQKVGSYNIASIKGESARKLSATAMVQQAEGAKEALAVAHTGRFKDIPDKFRIIETQAESAAFFGKSTKAAQEFLALKDKLEITYNSKIPIEPLRSSYSSPSFRPSPYFSPSPSPSPSFSPSPSPSPSFSPSPSPSPSFSPSPSPSPSFSPSPSPSPSFSPYFKPKKIILNSPINSDKTKDKGLFSVMVRRRGKFVQIAQTTDKNIAFGIGQRNVQDTAAASFKVTSSRGVERRPNFMPERYYESKKEQGVNIQKTKYRISSPGEKREITFKGIMMNRLKRRGLF